MKRYSYSAEKSDGAAADRLPKRTRELRIAFFDGLIHHNLNGFLLNPEVHRRHFKFEIHLETPLLLHFK